MPKGGRRSTSFKPGVSGNPQQIAEFARLSQERMDSAKAAQLAHPQVAQGDQVGQASSTAATQEKLRQVGALSGGRGNEGGNRAAARELGLTEQEVRRARTIDSITPRAKEAAREAGLDRNQSALLKVASYADEDQVGAVADIAKARADKAQAPAPVSVKPLRNLEYLAAGELANWIKITTPNDRTRVIQMLRGCADILEGEMHAEQAA